MGSAPVGRLTPIFGMFGLAQQPHFGRLEGAAPIDRHSSEPFRQAREPGAAQPGGVMASSACEQTGDGRLRCALRPPRYFFMRLRTIGAEAAARAASSAATNWTRRRVSMPSHSFVSRPIVFFEAVPAS
jgi:hypothetical protein